MDEANFFKGKTRITQYEYDLNQRKIKSRKSGIVIPEDHVKIPKIGQWSLSNVSTPSPAASSPIKQSRKKEESNSYIVKMSPFAKMTSAYSLNQKPINKPLAKVSIPKAANNTSISATQRLVDFPQGTVTTDLDDIIRSKYRRPVTALSESQNCQKENSQNNININTNVAPLTTQFFPLDFFDDSTYEEFSLEELMKDREAVSKISVKGKMEWLPCTVLDYDVSNHSFTIQFRHSKKLKMVSRLNVRFLRENVDKFNRRVAVARNNMAKYEAQLRFDAQIDMMPITELPSLAEIDFVDIHNRIGIKLMGKLLDICNSLDDEVKLDFKKLENRFEFEYNLEYNPLIPNRDEFMALREPKKPSPNYGLVCRPSIDFRKMLNSIKNSHLMAEPILQDGLFNVWNIFQNTQSKIFYTNGFPNEILTLDEYINKQKSLLNESSASFKK